MLRNLLCKYSSIYHLLALQISPYTVWPLLYHPFTQSSLWKSNHLHSTSRRNLFNVLLMKLIITHLIFLPMLYHLTHHDIQLPLLSLIGVPLDNLDSMDRSGVCPNTLDTTVFHWQIRFTRDGVTVLNGNFCIEGVQFDSGRVCHKDGVLVFHDVKDNEFNMTGQYDLQFVETGNDPVKLPIRFKPTGVYAFSDTIVFNPDDNPNFVLTYLIYSYVDDISLYFNNQFITNSTSDFFNEATVCFSATPPQNIMTMVLAYSIPNLSAKAAGNYTLVAGGTYYDTVSLVLDPNYNPPPTPAPNTTSNSSATPTETVTSTSLTIPSSTLSMVSPSPTSTNEVNGGNSSNISTTTIIAIIVVVVVVILVIFVVTMFVCFGFHNKNNDGIIGISGLFNRRKSVAHVGDNTDRDIELDIVNLHQETVNQPTAITTDTHLARENSGPDQNHTPNNEEEGQEQTDNNVEGDLTNITPTQQNDDHTRNSNQLQEEFLRVQAEESKKQTEEMKKQTIILQGMKLANDQLVANTGRTADNTQQSVEIQSEQLETQRETNELLGTNMVGENSVTGPLSSVSTPTIPPPNHTLSQPSTTSLPATNTSHTHSDTLTDHTHQDQPPHDQSIPQPPHTIPVEVSGDESPDHTSQVPRPLSTATPPPPVINADTSDDLSNDEDITERGVFGEESPAPRVRPVTTEEQLRLINLKLIDIHPESKELGIALGLDETTLISSTDEGHQRNLTDRERLQKVFVKWKRMGGVRTWRVIYDALVKMKFLDVAQKIKDSHPDLDINVPYDEDGYIQIMTDHLSAIEAHWYIFALHLHLDYSTLDEIEGVHRSEIHLSNVLRSWKRIKAGDANIEALFRALEDIGHRDLANELREDQEIVQAFP